MTQSSWVNPNGLPADDQITSARDLAILARALLHDFPEYDMYWHIPAIKFGKKVMRNYNTLIGRYDGADGMKTGFICASGFNLVAIGDAQRQAADRGGARLAVVAVSRAPRPRACSSAASIAARCPGWRRRSARSNRCSRSTPRRPICATRCAARTASARPPRRPTTTTSDDSPMASCCRACRRAPARPSALLRSGPTPVKPIVVYRRRRPRSRPRHQFANARAKLAEARQGQAQGRRRHARPQPPPAAQPAADAKATATAPALQTVSAPPSGAFTPTPSQPQRGLRALPTATDVSNPSAMSYAPATAEPAADRRADARPRDAAAAPAPQAVADELAPTAAPTPSRRRGQAGAKRRCQARRVPKPRPPPSKPPPSKPPRPSNSLVPRRVQCTRERRKALARLARLFDARMLSCGPTPDLMAGRGPNRSRACCIPVPATAGAQGASMSFLEQLKDDIVFLRGALRALKMTTPIAKNPTRVFPVVIEELADKFGDAPALISDRERFSYRALAERSNRYARWALAREPRQGRDGLPADAEPAGIHGGLDRHHPRRRRRGADQHQPGRPLARPLHRHRRAEAHHRRRRARRRLRHRRGRC